MESVAEPFPAFASTTSVPPSCVRFVRAVRSSPDRLLAFGVAYQQSNVYISITDAMDSYLNL